MNPIQSNHLAPTRRQFFGRTAAGIGTAALALAAQSRACGAADDPLKTTACLPQLHFAPKAKRVIYLFMSGGPSHIDLFDYKPKLQEHSRQGAARLRPHGPADHRHDLGAEVVPVRRADVQVRPARPVRAPGSASCCRTSATIADDIAIVKSLNTEAINHDPATTYIQTGSQQPGRPSLGAWLSYGLGSENQNLPGVRRA